MNKTIDDTDAGQNSTEVIYLAGGCFWGMEKLMRSIPGVVDAVSGYANGRKGIIPTYDSVSTGLTGYRETVRVEYDPRKVSLNAILFAYFRVIDPTVKNAQGNDHGTQYQAGIYYPDERSRAAVEAVADIEKRRSSVFEVEIEPIERFYNAEEYHQKYLDKHPGGYCHVSKNEFDMVSRMTVDPSLYRRPSDEDIQKKLSTEQYHITQLSGTELPFQNEYWNNHQKGIYVDTITGEPLFSSSDKFDSGTGWPSFSKGIDENTFVFKQDDSFGMHRTEVLSRTGNTHLGHVFYGEATPTGIRFCMNSASLHFIPYEDMEKEGYGYLKDKII